MRYPAFLTALALAVSLTPLAAASADSPPATLSVTGEGHVDLAPDMATVTLGVQTGADTARAALSQNSDAVAAMMKRLSDAGIEGRDIQTSGLTLGPRFDYAHANADGSQPITGYIASNMVTVQVRKIEIVGTVLDAAVSDGANTLNGVTFGLQDAAAPTDAARNAAVADARRKAELYAAAAGVKLGRVLSLSEEGGAMPPMPMAEARFAKAGAVPVAAGSLSIAATVQVVWEVTQ